MTLSRRICWKDMQSTLSQGYSSHHPEALCFNKQGIRPCPFLLPRPLRSHGGWCCVLSAHGNLWVAFLWNEPWVLQQIQGNQQPVHPYLLSKGGSCPMLTQCCEPSITVTKLLRQWIIKRKLFWLTGLEVVAHDQVISFMCSLWLDWLIIMGVPMEQMVCNGSQEGIGEGKETRNCSFPFPLEGMSPVFSDLTVS